MKTVVYKYAIEIKDEFIVHLPIGSVVLAVQMQRGEPFMWVRHSVVKNMATVPRKFRLAGTGHPIEGDWTHVDTFQMHGGELVFHVFEEET